jgi:hypothetical protein
MLAFLVATVELICPKFMARSLIEDVIVYADSHQFMDIEVRLHGLMQILH